MSRTIAGFDLDELVEVFIGGALLGCPRVTFEALSDVPPHQLPDADHVLTSAPVKGLVGDLVEQDLEALSEPGSHGRDGTCTRSPTSDTNVGCACTTECVRWYS